MIRKALLRKIFDAACMQRWNDKLRVVELTELDKQAHKMMIAYVLGKHQEKDQAINWIDIIEGGIFELLHRSVLTDIKPQIFRTIKENHSDEYKKLKQWVLEDELQPLLGKLWDTHGFKEKFTAHFENDNNTIEKKILTSAHFYATEWEIKKVINPFNQNGDDEIITRQDSDKEKINSFNLKGTSDLNGNPGSNISKFVNICGTLRFQLRWAHIHRMPRTSVLGHLLFVAIIAYLGSLDLKICNKGCFNNFFTGLFHDLPEVLTRDIISPVKRSIPTLEKIIKTQEQKQMNEKILPLLTDIDENEMRMFTGIIETSNGDTIGEFDNSIFENGNYQKKDDVNGKYNKDTHAPRNGQLVKAADQLAAFIEASVAIENGCASRELHAALYKLKPKSEKQLHGEQEKIHKEKPFPNEILDIIDPLFADFA